MSNISVPSTGNVSNATNASVNNTGQAAQTAAETGIYQDPVFIGVVVAALALIPILFIFKRYGSKLKSKLDDRYEGKTLSERLSDKQVNPTKEFGDTTPKKVDYGLTELGRLEKYYKTTEVTEEGILEDLHTQKAEDFEDISELELEDGQFKNLTMIVGPTGFVSRLKMKFASSDPLKNSKLSVYSVPKSSINNGDRVVIDDEKVDWNYSGGIYYSRDVQGITTMYNYSALSLIDDLTGVFANKGEITQALNEKFAEWKNKKEVENQAFIDYMKEKEDIDSDKATD